MTDKEHHLSLALDNGAIGYDTYALRMAEPGTDLVHGYECHRGCAYDAPVQECPYTRDEQAFPTATTTVAGWLAYWAGRKAECEANGSINEAAMYQGKIDKAAATAAGVIDH